MGIFGGVQKEELVRIGPPQSSVGAPLPALLANEEHLFVCYLVEAFDPNWDGTYIRLVDVDSAGESVAVLKIKDCMAHLFGPPNEEAIAGHRLAKLGLEPFSAFEVRNSTWIADLERANRVHPNHRPAHYERLRHFVFTFHDSVLEFVSEGFDVEITAGPIRDVMRRLIDTL